MKDVRSDVESFDPTVERAEMLGIVDLGDAVVETKEWSWLPFVTDNLLQLGWQF